MNADIIAGSPIVGLNDIWPWWLNALAFNFCGEGPDDFAARTMGSPSRIERIVGGVNVRSLNCKYPNEAGDEPQMEHGQISP